MNKYSKNSSSAVSPEANMPKVASHILKPVIHLDINANIIGCNLEFNRLSTIPKEQLLATDLRHSGQNKRFLESVQKAIKDGVSIFRGSVLLGSNLTNLYLECALLFTKDENTATITGYITHCFSHVTESQGSQIETKQQLSNVPVCGHAAVSVHESRGNTVYISPSIESLLGYSCAELMELDPHYPVYPDDVPIIMNVLTKLKGEFNFQNSRYRMVHKNGSVIPVETASYLINDASGNGNRIVNLTWDLRTLEKTEQALALSEQKYYQLVMNLTVGVSLISPGGQVLDANNAMKKIMGLPLDVELPDLNFFSLEMMKRVGISPQLNKCIKTKENISGEIRVKSTQKKPEIVLTYSFLPVLNHEGEIEIILGYANDLSQQKRAEDETREQADFLNLVINAIKTPFFVKDEKHRWVMLNIAALDMMGHTRETLIGKSDYDLYPKEQADVFWKCDEKVFETGSYSNEEIITWSDGSLHTIVTHKQLYIEKTSRKKFIIGTIHDITKYKEIENELRTSELKYHELFDNANDFIITLEPEGRITNANRTLLKYFHTNLKSLTHYSVFNFISDEDKAYAFILRDKIMAGEPMNPFDIRTIGTSRNTVIYEVKASAIEQNNNITGIQCVLSDVTQRRAISIKLEEYNKNLVELNNAKDKFFSIIAHDLRNPFSSILGFTELLLDDLENISKEELKDSLKIVYNSAKNSLNLLENLLSWSRLETGRLPFDLTKVVLTDVIDEVIEVLFSLAYRKKIELINLVDPAVLLFADKNMMITILNNLIMNAIKYTPAGGKVRIFTGEHFFQPKAGKEFVTINVADTGVGMTQDFIDRLFSLSKPPSSPGTENEQGTGLGLVLTHEMIGKHGGTISVTSIPDKGSIFTFSIPLYKTENII